MHLLAKAPTADGTTYVIDFGRQGQPTSWTIANDGTIRTDYGTSGLLSAFDDAVVNGKVIYPSVGDLLAGATSSSPIQLRGKPGATDVAEINLDFVVTGFRPPSPVVTTAGRFTDVVGVRISEDRASAVDPNDAAATAAAGAITRINFGSEIIWARNVGIVEVDVNTSDALSYRFTGCSS